MCSGTLIQTGWSFNEQATRPTGRCELGGGEWSRLVDEENDTVVGGVQSSFT